MFSALLLFGGSMADRVGSKNSYRNGMVMFVAASQRADSHRRCRSWLPHGSCRAPAPP
jgi:hypothetical protein